MRARALILVLLVALTAVGTTACKPAPVSCKTTQYKYDHKTLFVTWFTAFNEMRFCYDGTNAVRVEWTNNRTSNPTLPYTKGGVTTSAGIETFEGTRKRARNVSTHDIKCAQIVSGFDVKLRQYGYGSGNVTTWRSSVNGATDC